MLFALMVPVRTVYRLQKVITERHLASMAKLMLAASLVVAYGWCTEVFAALYSGSPFEASMLAGRISGRYAPVFWAMALANVAAPQLLWSRRVRRSAWWLFGIGVTVAAGMWLERYVIVVTSLHRDFIPSSWGVFSGTFWDWATLAGSAGLFLLCMLVCLRCMPMVSMVESGLGGGLRGRDPRDHIGGHACGLLAEFPTAERLVRAVEALQSSGCRKYEAYTPAPVPGLSTAGGSIPRWAFLGGVLGAAGGFGLQYWISAVAATGGVGGRPPNSWPAFIPVTFECAILCAVVATVIAMFAGSGLPRLHHPVFSAPNFSLAQDGRYYLGIPLDPSLDRGKAWALLKGAGAEEVADIAA
jgi:hypothetical protein